MPPALWPIVPSTSGWPWCPIMTISRPCSRIFATSTCTLVTSGQVASNTLSLQRFRLLPHRLRHAVRAEDHGRARRHLDQVLDEHRALAPQVLDHELVVHDLVPHVDRRAVQRERALDDLDGAVDAGAEAAGIGEQDFHA